MTDTRKDRETATQFIDPFNSDYWSIPLIAVSPDGTETKVKINDKSGKACVWGWSVWRRKGGYRTLGISVDEVVNIRNWKFYQEGNCPACQQGNLKELSIYDDWEGMLTCDKCGVRFKK